MIGAAHVAALFWGFSFGASTCMFACIPTLGTALLAGEGAHATWWLAARFNAGRWLGYTLLGGVSGGIGASLEKALQASEAALLFGTALFAAGLALWRKPLQAQSCRSIVADWFRANLFVAGLAMSLTPCAPLGALAAAAAASGSAWQGAWLGWMFGLGAILPAQLLLGYGLGSVSTQLRAQLLRHQPALHRLVALALMALGAGIGAGFWHL